MGSWHWISLVCIGERSRVPQARSVNASRFPRPDRRRGYNVSGVNILQVRRASPADAAGIVKVVEAVATERIHSAIDRAWTVEQEARYLASLSQREAFHVAVDADAGVVGFQSLDLWSSQLT